LYDTSAQDVQETEGVLMQQTRWQQIMCLCDAIAQEFYPDKIVLFGSYASGKPRPDSDVDLLVVMPFEGSPFHQAAVILGHVVRTVGVLPMDLLVRTAEQVQERLHMGDSFMRDIIAHGKVMYSNTVDAYETDHA
jgi:predicted nucleotidyltransferase